MKPKSLSKTPKTDEQILRELRLRLYLDFEFYCKHCVKIRDKSGKDIPLILKPAQKRLAQLILKQLDLNKIGEPMGQARVIILKARQMGFSTLLAAFEYWWVSQRSGQRAITVAQKTDATQNLLSMVTNIHKMMPVDPLPMKPSTRQMNRNELIFDELKSNFRIATAGGEAIGRSMSLNIAHLSEAAFYPAAMGEANIVGLLQAIPTSAGSMIFIESTANGVGGSFADRWFAAVKGENEFTPFFAAWYEDPDYRLPPSPDFTPSSEEIEVQKLYNLDNDQLMWRRIKIGQNGHMMFVQEYPSNPEEAFLTSGRPVFDPIALSKIVSKEPIKRMMLNSSKEWVENAAGELFVYAEPKSGKAYYIGADVAGGTYDPNNKLDYSVAQVLNGKREQVAIWVGKVLPDYFADILYELGKMYGYAKVCVESNNHGFLTNTRLIKDMQYPNAYTDIVEDELNDKYTEQLGFRTTGKSKTFIIDKLGACILKGEIGINNIDTVKELRTYIMNEAGKMTSESGCHDDHVMSLALANHIWNGDFEVIEVSDYFYANYE